jgi:hypothetical protein
MKLILFFCFGHLYEGLELLDILIKVLVRVLQRVSFLIQQVYIGLEAAVLLLRLNKSGDNLLNVQA